MSAIPDERLDCPRCASPMTARRGDFYHGDGHTERGALLAMSCGPCRLFGEVLAKHVTGDAPYTVRWLEGEDADNAATRRGWDL